MNDHYLSPLTIHAYRQGLLQLGYRLACETICLLEGLALATLPVAVEDGRDASAQPSNLVCDRQVR